MAPTWHESVTLAGNGPTGIVGPGYSIGAVTHWRKGAPPYIRAISLYFFSCGTNLFLSFAGHMAKRGASNRSRQDWSVNQVESSPPDHHQDTSVNHTISWILRSRFNRTFRDRGATRGRIRVFQSGSDGATVST